MAPYKLSYYYYYYQGGYVSPGFCLSLSFCLSVSSITGRVVDKSDDSFGGTWCVTGKN